jgi:hypothetical protein
MSGAELIFFARHLSFDHRSDMSDVDREDLTRSWRTLCPRTLCPRVSLYAEGAADECSTRNARAGAFDFQGLLALGKM